MDATASPDILTTDLVTSLRTVLRSIHALPYPEVTAEGTEKRASVALIIRISPSHQNWPGPDPAQPESIDDFFSRDWVRHGDPEVLFIKRASRKGDRWTSHIALPGGRRDPEDEDDRAAAVRETSEEVGLDLAKYATYCGNLPQRIVTVHWGKKPLLVLCPYVFLLTAHSIPPLKLQPTEVAATHWVPLRSLLSPSRRTLVYEDVSSRLANDETGVKKWMLSLILGKMMFAAIALAPSESLHSRETPAPDSTLQDNRYVRPTARSSLRALATRMYRWDLLDQAPFLPPEGPLLLWGLTLGVVADLLDLLPPHDALTLWAYPTFSPLDVRLAIALMTYRFKHRKRAELQAGTNFSTDSPDDDDRLRRSFGTVSESAVLVDRPDETGFHGLGTGMGENKSKKAAVSTMLEGSVKHFVRLLPEITDRGRYYDILRRAVVVALVGRMSVLVVLAAVAWRKWRKA